MHSGSVRMVSPPSVGPRLIWVDQWRVSHSSRQRTDGLPKQRRCGKPASHRRRPSTARRPPSTAHRRCCSSSYTASFLCHQSKSVGPAAHQPMASATFGAVVLCSDFPFIHQSRCDCSSLFRKPLSSASIPLTIRQKYNYKLQRILAIDCSGCFSNRKT